MEALTQSTVKENRTQKLLRMLNLAQDFQDPEIPKGVFSFSQYNSYKICAKAYEFKYIDGTKVPAYASTTKGASVHSGIEFMLLAKKAGAPVTIEAGLGALEKTFTDEAKNVKDWGETPEGLIKDEAVAILKHFALYALPKINPIEIEKGFAKKVGDVPMIGWIDLVDEQPSIDVSKMAAEEAAMAPKKRIVVDFKTGRAKWSTHELDKDPQLTLYSHVESTPYIRVDQLITKKKGPAYERGESTRTPRDAEILIEDINETVRYIKAGIFPKAPIDHWSCGPQHCSFWHLCRGKK